ncbi:MAG: arylsulfotransferase family protein, partial [Chitinophagales bacterium]
EVDKYKYERLDDFIESFGYDPTQKPKEGFFETPDSFPTFVINVNSNPAPGRIFYDNQQDLDPFDTNSFPTIIESDGSLIWARDEGMDGHAFTLNHNGYLSYYQYNYGWWKILDSNYNEIDSVRCGNGYEVETNGHDFQMYNDGHSLLIAYNLLNIDMTAYGGVPNAMVKGLIVQELDENRDVIFQWRSWDHFLFTDANEYASLTNLAVDYVHGNAVERDFDGNILISCRNMDELTKINIETGNIIWRMGGENNQFTFVNDNISGHFHQQHDLRRLPNGNITIYNNGNFLPVEISSAKEYKLDEVNKIATLVWHYEHPDVNGYKVYGRASGNVQRLANGNTLIDWGTITYNVGMPNVTEVDADKNIVWEMTFDETGQKSYRTYKFEWNPCSRVSSFTMQASAKPDKMVLNWQPAVGAISYKVRFRPLGTTNWVIKNIKQPKIKISGLLPATQYEWNVKTVCGNSPMVSSIYSETKTFQTPLKFAAMVNREPLQLNVYPVPASTFITIELEYATQQAYLIIRNLTGQVVYESTVDGLDGISKTVDINNWPKGCYLVEVNGGDTSLMRKIIVE